MDRPEQNSSSPLASVRAQGNTALSTIACNFCMALLPEEAQFCAQCGRAVKEGAARAVHGTHRQTRQQEQHKEQVSHHPIFQLLLEVIGSWSGRRVPPIMQQSAVECGAACLAMILTYY